MGLLNILGPFFSILADFLNSFIPQWAIIAVLGLMVGAAATTLYWRLSPQERILKVRSEARAVRNAMLHYDGDFNGVLALSRKSLALSLKELGLVIGPAAAASLPALCMIAFLGNAYDYVPPAAGSMVPVSVEPANVPVKWNPASAVDPKGGVLEVQWPKPGEKVRLESAQGRVLATFPTPDPIPLIGKFEWSNIFFGNPDGYIPASAKVSSIEVKLEPREFLPVGPEWLRGWETIFFAFAGIAALTFRKFLGVR